MKRKGYLLATAGGVAAAAAAGGAQAADLPLKVPMAPVVAAPSWAGFYMGLNAGVAWQDLQSSGQTYTPGNNFTHAQGSNFIGGGQIGYNWQHGNFVYGLEADLSGLSSGISSLSPKGGGLSSKMRWLSTVRGRVGLAVNDTLVYGTGGVAFARVQNSENFQDPDALPNVNNKSQSKTMVGWTLGGGIEHMFTPNWTFAAEALWVNLGNSDLTNNFSSQGTKTTRFSNQAVIGRLKVNYKF